MSAETDHTDYNHLQICGGGGGGGGGRGGVRISPEGLHHVEKAVPCI